MKKVNLKFDSSDVRNFGVCGQEALRMTLRFLGRVNGMLVPLPRTKKQVEEMLKDKKIIG
jgi:hypothetical protein